MSLRSPAVVLVFALLSAAACFRLGIWQIHRLEARRAANAEALAARTLPEVALDSVTTTPSLSDRRIRAIGRYDQAHEMVLRGYLMSGTPGVRIVTPLRPEAGDSAVLVLRGFVPSPDAMTADLDSLAEPGVVDVHGIGQTLPSAGGGERLEREGRVTWKRLDLVAIRSAIPYPIRDVYLLETRLPNDRRRRSGLPIRIEPPPLDDGPHLSYAIQWFAFGVTALVGGILIARKRTGGD
jgi:surfeit locus 1 family protein